MNTKAAREIKEKFDFTDKHFSRDILKFIRAHPKTAKKLFVGGRHELKWVVERYLFYTKKYGKHTSPRNLLFYFIIQEAYPDFKWDHSQDGTIIKHKIEGIQPSLLSYLLKSVPHSALNDFPRLDSTISNALSHMINELCLHQINHDISSFETWIKKGLAGEKLTIISPVCPDYAAIRIPSSQTSQAKPCAIRHRFTFDNLGTGLGVTAQHLMHTLPTIQNFFSLTLKIELEIIVAYGNFEGYSAENLDRMKIDEKTFHNRIQASASHFNIQYSEFAHAILFDELIGGKQGWQKEIKLATEAVYHAISEKKISSERLQTIALSRKGLYERWGGNTHKDTRCPRDFYTERLIAQIIEYTAMGEIIKKTVSNPLILGADDHKMGRFYDISDTIPILYLPRIYD